MVNLLEFDFGLDDNNTFSTVSLYKGRKIADQTQYQPPTPITLT